MKIFVYGPDRCGKSTAAYFLAKALDCEYRETGDILVNKLAAFYAKSRAEQATLKMWKRTIEACKNEFRDELRAIGDMLTDVAPTCLSDACSGDARIIVGMRRRRELLGYIHHGKVQAWPAVLIQIVGGPFAGQAGVEYELKDFPCDFLVRNNGALLNLRDAMYDIARQIDGKAA